MKECFKVRKKLCLLILFLFFCLAGEDFILQGKEVLFAFTLGWLISNLISTSSIIFDKIGATNSSP